LLRRKKLFTAKQTAYHHTWSKSSTSQKHCIGMAALVKKKGE